MASFTFSIITHYEILRGLKARGAALISDADTLIAATALVHGLSQPSHRKLAHRLILRRFLLLLGGTKASQTPDIRRAKQYWSDYCAVHNLDDSPTPNRTVRGGESEEGWRPTPLGRARGEGRAVACPGASARAFPAN